MGLEKQLKSEPDLKKMLEWYSKRTEFHISLVQKYCRRIYEADWERFSDLPSRGRVHDASKYSDPELTPYIFISWQYKCKDDGVEWEPPEGVEEAMDKATFHHIKGNLHHPESHSGKDFELGKRNSRGQAAKKVLDAQGMNDSDIAEMVADWCAMSEEKGNTPKAWADANVNKKWKFSDWQVELIYMLIDGIWDKEKT